MNKQCMKNYLYIVFASIVFMMMIFFAGNNPAHALSLYDDFSSSMLNTDKWLSREFIREISGGKFVSKVGANGSRVKNDQYFNFTNSGPITYIEADATLISVDGEYDSSDPDKFSFPSARLFGYFYNDGTGQTNSYLGEVNAIVRIGSRRGQLVAYWEVVKYTSATDYSMYNVLGSGDFPLTINLGQTYKLSLKWDQPTKTFTFGIDAATLSFTVADTIFNTPNQKYKGFGTDAWMSASDTFKAYVSATFDNVVAKGISGGTLVTDDFSSSTIDLTKWFYPEFVREIRNNQLYLSMKKPAYTSTSYIEVPAGLTNPENISEMQTKVTISEYANSTGEDIRARLLARFFNDGTTGGGYLGDIAANVRIRGKGTSPALYGEWVVYRHTNSMDYNQTQVLTDGSASAIGTFTTPISQDVSYTLYMSWDGIKFRFKINDEEKEYTPSITARYPTNKPVKSAVLSITNGANNGEAKVSAYFDDLMTGFLGGSISGTVKDTANLGISGAAVTVKTPQGTVVASTSTDANGAFGPVSISSPGPYTIETVKQGYEVVSAPPLINIASSVPNININMTMAKASNSLPQYRVLTINHPEPQQGARFGAPVLWVNDLDGDGIDDFIATAAMQNNGTGKVYIFSGRTGTLIRAISPPPETFYDSLNGNFSSQTGGAGYDLDGGGKQDFILNAPRDTVDNKAQAGRLHIYRGEDFSLLGTITSPNPQAGELFGTRASVGDINGDGIPEIVVAATGYSNQYLNQGRLYVFNAQTGGFLFSINDPQPQASSSFGLRRMIVDINNDGKGKIVVTNYNKNVNSLSGVGVVYVFDGSGNLSLTINNPEPSAYAYFGSYITWISDQNGDGKRDLVISAPGKNNSQGKIYIMSGSDGSLIKSINPPAGEAEDNARFGGLLAHIGDINNDGIGEILIVAPQKTVGGVPYAGKVYALNGKTGILFDGSIIPPELEPNILFGNLNIANPGDVDGDGIADFVASSVNKDSTDLLDVGAVYLFRSNMSFGISGKVIGLTGQGVPGVAVTVKNLSKSNVGTATTDSSGNFNVNLQTAGSYTVEAAKTGYELLSVPQMLELSEANPVALINMLMKSGEIISLGSGWNFISFKKLPANLAPINDALANVSGVRIVWGFNNQTKDWLKFKPSDTNSTLSSFEFGKGYWIYMNADGIIDTTNWIGPSTNADRTLQFYPDWNLIGFFGTEGSDVVSTLNTASSYYNTSVKLEGKWDIVWSWKDGVWFAKHSETSSLPVQTLSVFNQNRAYWLKIKQGQTVGWTQ